MLASTKLQTYRSFPPDPLCVSRKWSYRYSFYTQWRRSKIHSEHSQLVLFYFFSRTSQLFLPIKPSVCLGTHQNTTINCAFQFVSGKHTFECMSLVFPSGAALALQCSVSVWPFRSHARCKITIICYPKPSACALVFANSLRFRTGCSLSVILSAFQRRAQYLLAREKRAFQRVLCLEIYNANVICCVFLSRFWYGLPRNRVMRWGSVRVNFKTIPFSPLESIIIIFKDACLVHFARDPSK